MRKGKGLLTVVGLALLTLAVTPALAGDFYVGGHIPNDAVADYFG